MKKILISLLIFFSIFFTVGKVRASTYNYYSSTEISQALKNSLEIELPSQLIASYQAVENGILDNYGNYYSCWAYDTSTKLRCYVSDNSNNFGAYSTPTTSSLSTYIVLNSSFDSAVYEVSIQNTSISSVTTLSNNIYYTAIGGSGMITRTNISYFLLFKPSSYQDYSYKAVTSDGYTFNRGDIFIYNNGSEYVVNTEHKSADEILKGNTFDAEVDDYNYSKMVFNLKQEDVQKNNYNFDMTYKIETVGEIDEQGNLLSKDNSIEFLEPYIEYTLENRTKYLYLSNSDSSHNNPSSLWELASCPALPSGATGVKLIIPMESTTNVRYKVYFQTVVGFEVSYEYDDDVVDYYETIDLSNKYGVMFMPKIVANNYSSIYAIFEFGGIESISVYETYDYNQNPIKVYEDLDTYISFNIDSELTNYNVFFKSEQKPLRSLVRYDTRYFTYHIVDSKYSVGIVENPNTGESTFVDFGNTGTTKVTFTDISSVFTYISEQLSDNNEAYILFSNSVRTFFATMPSDVFILIITVTAVLFLGIALALGGWK